MNITEVRIKLLGGRAERLKAFGSITFDEEFIVRDLKIVEGPNGPFVAMPSRKLAFKCRKCGNKNHLLARFCDKCGVRLPEARPSRDGTGRPKLHVDVAHPLNTACREQIQQAVLEAYRQEVELSRQPGYQPQTVDLGEEYEESSATSDYEDILADLRATTAERNRDRSTDLPDREPEDLPLVAEDQTTPVAPPPPPMACSPAPRPPQPPREDDGFSNGIV